jgi:hypothetical protein
MAHLVFVLQPCGQMLENIYHCTAKPIHISICTFALQCEALEVDKLEEMMHLELVQHFSF